MRIITEEMGLSQGRLCVGIKTGIPPVGDGFYALTVMNEVFGGGPDSRLFANIRVRENLCYYVHSTVYRFKAMILAEAGIGRDDFNRVTEMIGAQLEGMKRGITDDELRTAKAGLVKRMRGMFGKPQAIMDFYLAQHMLSDGDGADGAIGRINGVAAGDCAYAAESAVIDAVYFLS